MCITVNAVVCVKHKFIHIAHIQSTVQPNATKFKVKRPPGGRNAHQSDQQKSSNLLS